MLRTLTRLATAAVLAGGVGLGARLLVTNFVTANLPGALAEITAVILTGGTTFLWLSRRMRITELQALLALPRRR